MKPRTIAASLLLWMGMTAVAVAQNPFAGTWKQDLADSHLAGATIKFRPAAGDSIELDSDGTAYSFRTDGKAYRMTSGELAIWSQENPTTWTTSYRNLEGKPLSTGTWTLSGDGAHLNMIASGTLPDGESYSNSTTYERSGGTAGLLGSWKSTDVTLSTPEEMIIEANGLGGLSIKIPTTKFSFLGAFDGKEVSPTGPDIPPTLTMAIERSGPSSFRVIKRLNGIVTYSSVYTVSADRKTMTEIGNASGDPSHTMIWEKQ